MKTQEKSDANLTVDFRSDYEFSGFYLHLGPGIVPKEIRLYKENAEIFHIIKFDGSCKIHEAERDDQIDGSKSETNFYDFLFQSTPQNFEFDQESISSLCQNAPARSNIEFYVNLLSRRPGQFGLNESQDLQNFISASKITIRFLDWADQQISTVSNQVRIICEINTMKMEIFSFSHYGISERSGAVNAMA